MCGYNTGWIRVFSDVSNPSLWNRVDLQTTYMNRQESFWLSNSWKPQQYWLWKSEPHRLFSKYRVSNLLQRMKTFQFYLQEIELWVLMDRVYGWYWGYVMDKGKAVLMPHACTRLLRTRNGISSIKIRCWILSVWVVYAILHCESKCDWHLAMT